MLLVGYFIIENGSKFSSSVVFLACLLALFFSVSTTRTFKRNWKRCANVVLFISFAQLRTGEDGEERILKCSTSGWEKERKILYRRRKVLLRWGEKNIEMFQAGTTGGHSYSLGISFGSFIRSFVWIKLFFLSLSQYRKDFFFSFLFLQMFDHYNWFILTRTRDKRAKTKWNSHEGESNWRVYWLVLCKRKQRCLLSFNLQRRKRKRRKRKDHSIIALCWWNIKSLLCSVRGRFCVFYLARQLCNILKKGLFSSTSKPSNWRQFSFLREKKHQPVK